MATTTYQVQTIDAEGVAVEDLGTKSKKATAEELARTTRKDQSVGVRVTTSSGKVVLELAAPKKIKMSKPYTRVVPLPEGFEVPEGFRVAYVRPRKNVALLHDAEAQEYTVRNYVTGEDLATFSTTRQGGRFIVDEVKAPAKASA